MGTPRPALNMPSTKVFLCLIGVIILATEATGNDEVQCSGSATLLTTSPGLDMVLCKDMTMSTCEKDFETLCPAGWNLCTPGQFNNRNDDWDFNWLEAKAKPLGVIYCYTRAYAYDGDVPINYVTEARHYGLLQEEEDRDDGNDSNMDECMNTCTWKEPRAHGLNGC